MNWEGKSGGHLGSCFWGYTPLHILTHTLAVLLTICTSDSILGSEDRKVNMEDQVPWVLTELTSGLSHCPALVLDLKIQPPEHWTLPHLQSGSVLPPTTQG